MKVILVAELEVNEDVTSSEHNDMMNLEMALSNAIQSWCREGKPFVSAVSRMETVILYHRDYEVTVRRFPEDEAAEPGPVLSRHSEDGGQ